MQLFSIFGSGASKVGPFGKQVPEMNKNESGINFSRGIKLIYTVHIKMAHKSLIYAPFIIDHYFPQILRITALLRVELCRHHSTTNRLLWLVDEIDCVHFFHLSLVQWAIAFHQIAVLLIGAMLPLPNSFPSGASSRASKSRLLLMAPCNPMARLTD